MQTRILNLNHADQQGEICIYRFGGLELKKALLDTRSVRQEQGCFDPDIRLIFTLEGRTHLNFPTQSVCLEADEEYEAVLLPINQPVDGEKIFYCGRQNEIVVFCSSAELERMGCPAHVLKILRQSHLQPHYFRPDSAIRRQLKAVADMRLPHAVWGGFHYQAQTMMLMNTVLQHLFPLPQPSEYVPNGRPCHKRVQKLLSLLQDPSRQNANLDTLARLCHSNPTTLQQDFQTAFGISIARYRREQRLQTARELLKQKISVTEAAQQTGYENPECFSKAFKKYFGYSPSKYQKC